MVTGASSAESRASTAAVISEDEQLRCMHMHRMISDHSDTSPSSPAGPSIPKVIVQFWDDASDVPPDVVECLDSWTALLERGYQRLIFDDASALRFISDNFTTRHVKAFGRCRHPAMRSDYFRLCYLVRSGGFYVDADEVYKGGGCDFLFDDDRLKVQPLCYDTTTGEMVAADIFMQSQDAQPGWIYYVNNNPIVAPPGHAVLRRALARASQLLLDGSASRLGVQSTTGPGNLTACLVAHEVERAGTEVAPDYAFLPQWDSLSVSRWPLSYRHDARNWRLWDPST